MDTVKELVRQHWDRRAATFDKESPSHSAFTDAQAHALVRPGRLLFSFHERTYGDLALYEVPPPGQRPASGPGPGGTG